MKAPDDPDLVIVDAGDVNLDPSSGRTAREEADHAPSRGGADGQVRRFGDASSLEYHVEFRMVDTVKREASPVG